MTKQVPVAAFKDRVSEYIAEAEAGDEIIITRHGKPAAKLVSAGMDKRAMHREAVEKLFALGRQVYERNGPTSREEIQRWIEEDRP